MKNTFFTILVLSLTPMCCRCQEGDKAVAQIDAQLTDGQTTISGVLSNPRYMNLHSLTSFRQIIKKHARPGKLKIITNTEPGRRIIVKGRIETSKDQPVTDALLYFYHTSAKGWYSDTAAHILAQQGDMGHARLFGYLKTDKKGEFEIETVQPQGYPGSDFPGHIHVMVWKEGQVVPGLPNELQFDDDPRLTPARKSRSLKEGNLIEKNTGSPDHPVYFYKISARAL